MSTSLDVLRDEGPMTLRDLTMATSRKMGGWTLLYDNVDAVMRVHEEGGEARCEKAEDWRDNRWSAVVPTSRED